MRIVIDCEALAFLPIKHDDLFVCANLAWIECYPGQPYMITSTDESFLMGLTDLEVMILYKHTTGETATNYGARLKKILLEMVERIPVREVNAAELERQAAMVHEVRSERYLYNPGQSKPLIQPELFKHKPVELPKAPNEAEIANAPARVARSAPFKPPAPTPSPSAPAARTGTPSAPRQANVAGVIWQVADEQWEAAGKPTDTKVLLALRRGIMDILEEKHGTKRVTSSNELGRWMKTKV